MNVLIERQYGSAGISEKHLCSWEHMLLVAGVSGHAAALNDNEFRRSQPEMVRKWVAEMSTKATFQKNMR